MEWVADQKWKKWFAWHRVLIKGIIGESHPKIVWLKMVERRTGVGHVLSYAYVTYEYREILQSNHQEERNESDGRRKTSKAMQILTALDDFYQKNY